MGLDSTTILQPVFTKTPSCHGVHDKPGVHLTARLVRLYLQSDNMYRLPASPEFGANVVLDVFLDGSWLSDRSTEHHNGIIFDLESYF